MNRAPTTEQREDAALAVFTYRYAKGRFPDEAKRDAWMQAAFGKAKLEPIVAALKRRGAP